MFPHNPEPPRLTERHIELFWRHVERCSPDECWPWTAARDRDGYGMWAIWMRDRKRYRMVKAHRAALFLATGLWPEQTGHSCDNPPCCNDAHLFPTTNTGNMADARSKGRMLSGDRHWWHTRPETVPRGEACPYAKLTNESVLELRRLYASGQTTQKELGKRFHITSSMVSMIVRHKRWTHI